MAIVVAMLTRSAKSAGSALLSIALFAFACDDRGGDSEPGDKTDVGDGCEVEVRVLEGLDATWPGSFSPREVLERASGEFQSSLTWSRGPSQNEFTADVATNFDGQTSPIRVKVDYGNGEVRFVERTSAGAATCPSTLEIDVTAEVNTDDGALSESVEARLILAAGVERDSPYVAQLSHKWLEPLAFTGDLSIETSETGDSEVNLDANLYDDNTMKGIIGFTVRIADDVAVTSRGAQLAEFSVTETQEHGASRDALGVEAQRIATARRALESRGWEEIDIEAVHERNRSRSRRSKQKTDEQEWFYVDRSGIAYHKMVRVDHRREPTSGFGGVPGNPGLGEPFDGDPPSPAQDDDGSASTSMGAPARTEPAPTAPSNLTDIPDTSEAHGSASLYIVPRSWLSYYPYRNNGKFLSTKWIGGQLVSLPGSGTMVGPRHVMTAAHVMIDEETGQVVWESQNGWDSEFRPGQYRYNDQVHGSVDVQGGFYPAAYQEGVDGYDVAVVIIADTKSWLGWYGMCWGSESYLTSRSFASYGYPGDSQYCANSYSGTACSGYQYRDSVDWCRPNSGTNSTRLDMGTTCDAMPGQSGAAVWGYYNGSPCAFGNVTSVDTYHTYGFRMRQYWVNWFRENVICAFNSTVNPYQCP